MTLDPLNVSYYFHPDDRDFYRTLDRYLAPLKRNGRIRTWYEQEVLAGEDWQRECDLHLRTDHLLLLLISPDFLAWPRALHQIDLALDRHQDGDAVVIPILVRPCLWQQTLLSTLPILLPRSEKALSLHPHPEEVWQEIVADLIQVMNSIQQQVFMVYAPQDRDMAERIYRDLTTSSIAPSRLESHQFSSDFPLRSFARHAICNASVVVLIASPDTISSHAVQVQMNLVDDYQRPIVAIWARGEEWDRSYLRKWRVQEVIDARAERYETVRAILLARLKQKTAFEPSSLHSSQFSSPPRNPYKGLRPFTANDTCDFFGRTALIEEMAKMLEKMLVERKGNNQQTRLLAVVGASGSGKSSVVMAGLLPCLREGGVFDSQEWIYLNPIVPGTDPLEALAVSLAQQRSLKRDAFSIHKDVFGSDSLRSLHLLTSGLAGPTPRKVVLVIDQFEEIFTLTTSEEVRQRFFLLLSTAVTIMTLRN